MYDPITNLFQASSCSCVLCFLLQKATHTWSIFFPHLRYLKIWVLSYPHLIKTINLYVTFVKSVATCKANFAFIATNFNQWLKLHIYLLLNYFQITSKYRVVEPQPDVIWPPMPANSWIHFNLTAKEQLLLSISGKKWG